jgi:GNAT superfamily N-acetyltransferase
VSGRVRKIKRRREAGEITVEQTRDVAQVAALIEGSRITLKHPPPSAACYLMAFFGAEPAGAVGVETVVDAAYISLLFVTESTRRRGIGAALIMAARKAAHTRGARRLFALATDGNYLRRFGFVPAALDEFVEAFGAVPGFGAIAADPARMAPESARCGAFCLDISRDGVIER